jgi:hypothetical protein
MSFTFDDIGRPLPVGTSVKLGDLMQRIEQLRTKGGDDPEINAKIATLEQQRQKLVNKHAHGLKAPQIQPTAAEHGIVGATGNVTKSTAELQRRVGRRLGGLM